MTQMITIGDKYLTTFYHNLPFLAIKYRKYCQKRENNFLTSFYALYFNTDCNHQWEYKTISLISGKNI